MDRTGQDRLGRPAQARRPVSRARASQSGATGIAAAHPDVLESSWPILIQRVAPFFIGKDARDLESLMDGVYLANSNYKWQGLPFWVPVASVEIAMLDLLGKVARQADRRTVRRGRHAGTSPSIARAAIAAIRPRQEIAYLQKTRRRDRRQGDQVPPRRPHALRRCVDAARPGADSAHPQDVRRRDDDLRRRQRLIRRADWRAHRPR